MGTWNLLSLTGEVSNLDTPSNFGSNLMVKIRLQYVANKLGAWKESPVLEWNEKFTTLDHKAKTYWIHENNMFTQKPGSPTFSAWSARYIQAYNYVTKGESFCKKGSVAFYNVKGTAITKKDLGNKPDATDMQKAEIIRSYLKSKGGIIEAVVHDIPSIVIGNNDQKHIERLLLFNIGMAGGVVRLRAMQYVNMDASKPRPTWARECKLSTFSRMDQNTQGLKQVETPSQVKDANPTLVHGEFL